MVRRINAGEPFDFLLAAPAHINELIKAGKIIPETGTDLARSGIGVAVHAGVTKPDVSAVDAFERALLAARSVAYLKEGQSGVYVAGRRARAAWNRRDYSIEGDVTRDGHRLRARQSR
jgi:molybdate transport system substrate-binding protein